MQGMFEPSRINNLIIRNRFIRSATYEGMAAEDGSCTMELINLVAGVAEGGVGLIISSHAYVRKDGQAGPGQLGIDNDSLIEGLLQMTRNVHNRGCRIVAQLAHGGYFASTRLTNQVPLVPSRVEGFTVHPCRSMEEKDIREVIESFGRAALRAREAGFDGVQIHSAHGYLLNQFLSPAFNRRSDRYGGPVENRARLLLEIIDRVKAYLGQDFPVLVKLNCRDFQDGGLELGDSLEVGGMLQAQGVDAIELSGGSLASGRLGPIRSGINSEKDEAYFREEAKAFKEHIQVPLILVGGIRSFSIAERLIREGYADYISMSRPFICEPGLIARWESGDRRRAECNSDGLCLKGAISGKGLYCVTREKKEND